METIEYDGGNIILLKNIISEEICDKIVNFILHNPIHIKNENNNYLNCDSIEVNKYIDHLLYEITSKAIFILNKNYDFTITRDCGYNLRKVHGESKKHVDGVTSNNINTPRILSLIGNFSNNDGGEFNFYKQDVKFKLNKGDVVVFPPYWTHPHKVSAPSPGTYRHTFITWLH